MKVRYTDRPDITGDSSTFNMGGVGEVIVYYPEGEASSEEIRELEVYLDSRREWVSLSGAFKSNDVITDDRVTRFHEPRNDRDRQRGWSD